MGPFVARVATMLGTPFMPWQRYVVDTAMEYEPDSNGGVRRFFYEDVGVTTPRQQAKTTTAWSVSNWRAASWPDQLLSWTGQTGEDARHKWFEELVPGLERSELSPTVRRIYRARGSESITYTSGSLLGLASVTAETGHGSVRNQVVWDELFADTDNRREAAWLPTMTTVVDSQLWWVSTAGTQASTVYNRRRRKGRETTVDDPGEGVAYFEWSAPEDWDPDDIDALPSFMPAIGYTTSVRKIATLMASGDHGDNLRAYGNIPTAGADTILPLSEWHRVSRPDVTVTRVDAVGFAVSKDRDRACVAVADKHGNVELVKDAAGTGWLARDLDTLTGEHRCVAATVNNGPGAGTLTEIADPHELKPKDMAQACGLLYNAVLDRGALAVRREPVLDTAIQKAMRRYSGDQWVWNRSAADAVALEAVTVAWWTARNAPAAKHGWAGIMGGSE